MRSPGRELGREGQVAPAPALGWGNRGDGLGPSPGGAQKNFSAYTYVGSRIQPISVI